MEQAPSFRWGRHERELKETQKRYGAGTEESTDWADAKRELRK